VIELTQHADALIVPILIATVGAAWVVKRLGGGGESIYSG